jgi:hypothetical protein
MAIVVFAELSSDELPAALSLEIGLLDSKDEPVELPSPPDGQLKPFSVNGVATAVPKGDAALEWEPVRVPFVAQLGPQLPVPPGDYKFVITVSSAGGDTVSDELRFRILKAGEST